MTIQIHLGGKESDYSQHIVTKEFTGGDEAMRRVEPDVVLA